MCNFSIREVFPWARSFNGHGASGKQANLFWQFLPFFFFFAWNNQNSSCVYTVGIHERSSDCLDTVLPVFKFIINIGCLYIEKILSLNWKSSVAQWWEHQPPESGVMSSKPEAYIFLWINLFIFSFSFLFIFLNFEAKQSANIYWKYDDKGFAIEKRPRAFLFFKIANTQHKGCPAQ